jgi:hypothetical protein
VTNDKLVVHRYLAATQAARKVKVMGRTVIIFGPTVYGDDWYYVGTFAALLRSAREYFAARSQPVLMPA